MEWTLGLCLVHHSNTCVRWLTFSLPNFRKSRRDSVCMSWNYGRTLRNSGKLVLLFFFSLFSSEKKTGKNGLPPLLPDGKILYRRPLPDTIFGRPLGFPRSQNEHLDLERLRRTWTVQGSVPETFTYVLHLPCHYSSKKYLCFPLYLTVLWLLCTRGKVTHRTKPIMVS